MTEVNVSNPWHVDSLQAFWFLKCPECFFDTQEVEIFREHSLENHPLSIVLFGKELKEETLYNDYHSEDHNQEYHENFSENYSENPSENNHSLGFDITGLGKKHTQLQLI